MIPTMALKATETIKNQRATRLGFIFATAKSARDFRALQNICDYRVGCGAVEFGLGA